MLLRGTICAQALSRNFQLREKHNESGSRFLSGADCSPGKLDVAAINRFTRFAVTINHAQTVTKRSFPAILLKDLVNQRFFEQGQKVHAEAFNAALNLNPKVIQRLLTKLVDKGTFRVDGSWYSPSKRVVSALRGQLDHAGIQYLGPENGLGLRVLEPCFSRLRYVSTSLSPLCHDLSGRYLCVENVIWQKTLTDPGKSLSCSEISRRARVPKSTLTTMLDQARSYDILSETVDASDARVSRWKINLKSAFNAERYHILKQSYIKQSLAYGFPQQ